MKTLRVSVSLLALWFAGTLFADESSDLLGVVILSRHGVRSSLTSSAGLKRLSDREWPKWDIGNGILTEHGFRVMRQFGGYYGEYLRAEGLLPAGNDGLAHAYFRSNVVPRTVATAKAIGEGLFPGAEVGVVSFVGRGKERDPMFDPEGYREFSIDGDAALASAKTIGVEKKTEALRPVLREIAGVLTTPTMPVEKQPWWQKESSFKRNDKALVSYSGPVTHAFFATDNFFMQYLEGLPLSEVGWGKVGREELVRFSALHGASFGFFGAGESPYASRVYYSTMGDRILRTLRAMGGEPRPAGALGKSGDNLVVIGAHDSTVFGIGALFGFRWKAPDNLAPGLILPGSALMFEVRRDKATSRRFVRTRFVCQTLDQIRNELPVTLAKPPFTDPVAVAGVKTTGPELDQDWDEFLRVVGEKTDPAFVLDPAADPSAH